MRPMVTTAVIGALAAGLATPAFAEPIDRGRVSVDVVGEGPDVVMIPGLASSRDVWSEEAARLSGDYRLHLVQLAGFAGEDAGPAVEGDVVAPAMEAVHDYIVDADLDRPVVIGHSMGGLMGMMLALEHPEDLSRLVIVDSLPFLSAGLDPNATAESIEPMAAATRDGSIAMSEDDYATSQRVTMMRYVRTPERRDEATAWGLESDRSVVARAMYEVMTTDLRDAMAEITTPIRVVYAYAPEMGPEAMIDGLYEAGYAAAPDVGLVRIDESFHFIMLDQPEAFHEAIVDVLP